ncbi:MAG: hypothetical protein M0021_10990 [Clostridia bacterium]|nr:hypothetical protein [Clostridia bacterium]
MALSTAYEMDTKGKETFLAGSIFKQGAYNYQWEPGFKPFGGSYSTRNNDMERAFFLKVMAEMATAPKCLDWNSRGLIGMFDAHQSQPKPLDEIVHGFLKISTITKVITLNKDKLMQVWVVTKVNDIKTKRKYCDFFAEMIEKMDPDLLFDLRILSPNSNEFQQIPIEAIIYERD